MVSLFTKTASLALAAGEAGKPLIERLDPRSRIAVLSALLGILLVGILMLVMIVMGGRYVRRFMRRPPRSVPPIDAAGENPTVERHHDETA